MPASLLIGGHAAGRIQPTNWTPPGGEWCYLVGADSDGIIEEIEDGEESGIEQSIDLTGIFMIVFAMKFRQTSTPGRTFRLSVRIDDTEWFGFSIPTGTTVEYVRRAINATRFTGVHNVAFMIKEASGS